MNDLHRYYGSDPSYRESMPCSECGKVGGCEHFPSARDDHSASRNVDVLRHEAPHLLAQPDEPRPITTTEINDAITDAISWLIVAEREHPDCPGITATKHRLAALAGNVVPL